MPEQPDNEIYAIYYKRYPYPFRFGSYLAILRTLMIKPLVTQLYDYSRLNNQMYARLLRTRQLIRHLIYFGLDSEKGQKSIAMINHAHRSVVANNDDYRYVLSTFFLEPFRWNTAFEKKAITPDDQQQVVDFWCKVGERMFITDLYTETSAWLEFQQAYEADYSNYTEQGHDLAVRSIQELIKQSAPFGLQTLARQTLIATIDPNVRQCLQLPSAVIPSWVIARLLNTVRVNFEPKRDIVDKPLS